MIACFGRRKILLDPICIGAKRSHSMNTFPNKTKTETLLHTTQHAEEEMYSVVDVYPFNGHTPMPAIGICKFDRNLLLLGYTLS